MEIEIKGEKLKLLPQRACYWDRESMLIVSDLHLGKAGHFRKHGIPVSKKVHNADLAILHYLLESYSPARLILLGDLFHSVENLEWVDFVHFMSLHEKVRFTLIKGNHDILNEYPQNLEVIHRLEKGPFSFTHIREEDHHYNISGHIHPGVTIRGKARQGMTMPCFLFAQEYAIFPAFGQFTGIKKIRPLAKDRVFAVADQSVIELR